MQISSRKKSFEYVHRPKLKKATTEALLLLFCTEWKTDPLTEAMKHGHAIIFIHRSIYNGQA